jgi:5-methyltetrahydropteroyltriglutamate--homocysteine methyltransferase
VKITMTGPHLLAAVAYDEYYRDTPRMIGDFGKLLHQNLKRLAEAGCRHIQIDEPYFTMAADDEERTAVDAINTAIEGLPNDMHIMMHICQGNYAVGPDYDGQIGHRYFDQGKWSPSARKAMRGSLPLYGVAAGVRKVAQLPPHGASLNERCRNEIQGG